MKKDFDKWNGLKKDIHKNKGAKLYHEREICDGVSSFLPLARASPKALIDTCYTIYINKSSKK